MIVGLAGRSQAGKDTAAKILLQRGFTKHSFAQPIKQIVANFLGIDVNDIEKAKDKRFPVPLIINMSASLNLIDEIKKVIDMPPKKVNLIDQYLDGKMFDTIRELLQYLGTDIGRDLIDENMWVDLAIKTRPELTIFTDVRFPNEIHIIRKAGGKILYIDRPQISLQDNLHASESAIRADMCDRTISNKGTIEELHNNILNTLELE